MLKVESSFESRTNVKELYFQYEKPASPFESLGLWCTFCTKKSTDVQINVALACVLNSQIDVVRLLHFYWAKATDFTELKLCEISVKCWAKWFTLINHSWNQVKTSYWLLIDVKCWFWTFFAPKCFLTFLGYKIYSVNHACSYKKCDYLIDVKGWFWAFFAPKYFSANFWTMRSTS